MEAPPSGRWSTAWKHCLVLVALAIIVRSVGLGFGLPHAVARPDEETLVGNALRLERVDGWNPSFFSYPSLMIYTAFGSYKLLLWGMQWGGATEAETMNALFIENPAPFHLLLRIISVVCGSLTAAVVYLTARQLFGRRTALPAGLAICLCYLHVRDSHFGVTDVPCVFLGCLAFWQLAKLHRRGRYKHLLWASVFAGLSIGTKYTSLWLGVPFAVAIVGSFRRRGPHHPLVGILKASITAFALTLAVFAATSPFFFLDITKAWEHFSWEMFLLKEEGPIAEGINGYLDHLRISLGHGLGWPMLAAALAGGLWMAWRRSGKGLLLWSLPVSYYVFTGHSNRIFIRYMDIVLPFLAIGGAWAVRSAYVVIRRWWCSRGGSRFATGGPILLTTVVLLIPGLLRISAFDRCISRTDTRGDLRHWMVDHIPPQEPILWSGGGSAMPYMLHHQPIRMLDATEKVLPREPEALPRYRWIVLVEWPRAYYLFGDNTRERAFLSDRMRDRYELVHQIDRYKADLPPELFSPLDHFYMSYQQPGILHRPGPGFSIYRRID